MYIMLTSRNGCQSYVRAEVHSPQSRDHEGVFIYYVLDRARANLAMARRKVLEVEAQAAI